MYYSSLLGILVRPRRFQYLPHSAPHLHPPSSHTAFAHHNDVLVRYPQDHLGHLAVLRPCWCWRPVGRQQTPLVTPRPQELELRRLPALGSHLRHPSRPRLRKGGGRHNGQSAMMGVGRGLQLHHMRLHNKGYAMIRISFSVGLQGDREKEPSLACSEKHHILRRTFVFDRKKRTQAIDTSMHAHLPRPRPRPRPL